MQFDWDEGNKHKSLTKHGIGVEEAESVFASPFKFYYRIHQRAPEFRYLCLGVSKRNRLLSVVFCFRKGKVRIISARKANKNEKRRFEEKSS